MRKYELMTIFPIEEDLSKAAQESVRSILGEFGAEIESETPYGDRELCYAKSRRVMTPIPANTATGSKATTLEFTPVTLSVTHNNTVTAKVM